MRREDVAEWLRIPRSGRRNYTLALAADKGQGRRLESFGADELENLCHTVINRANAKLGKGKPENRNKSQRSKALKTGLSPSEGPLEPAFNDRRNELQEADTERTHAHVQDTRSSLPF